MSGLYGFFGRVSSATDLREGLEASESRMREIADRVAKSSLGGSDGFALPSGPGGANSGFMASGSAPNTNLENDMASLADEEIRNEAQSHLLAKAYETIRASLADH